MKGAVFIALNDMIEQQFGMEQWESLLAEVQPESGGIYTSTLDYNDAEIVDFVLAISNQLNLPSEVVTRKFGQFLFDELNRKYPIFTNVSRDLFSFLMSIESVIHKEVRKLYENPNLPTLDCKLVSDKVLQLHYESPRKLCYLAEGLVFGAALHFNETISIKHELCMHKQASEYCLMHIIKDA